MNNDNKFDGLNQFVRLTGIEHRCIRFVVIHGKFLKSVLNFKEGIYMYTDIRWQQRFQNFEKAFVVFKRRIEDYRNDNKSEAFQMALIQAFEVIMELSWKTLKDYLVNEGMLVNSPKEVIRQAFQFDIIDNGEDWMDALAKRNLTTHTYDEKTFNEILVFIATKFVPIVEKLYDDLKKEMER